MPAVPVTKEHVKGASTRKSHAIRAVAKRARQQLLDEPNKPNKLPGTRRSLRAKVRSPTPPKLTGQSASNILLKARRAPEELPAGHVVYADLLLSLHASTRLSTVALQQLHRLRSAVEKGLTHTDPYDVLILQLSGQKLWTLCTPRASAHDGLVDADAAQARELEADRLGGCTSYTIEELNAELE